MIFNGLTPVDGDECLQSAVSAMLIRAKKCGLRQKEARWSLAELGPDEADLDWLKSWARQVRGTTLLPWLNSWKQHKEAELTGAASVGLLLLMLATEVARREASEGMLWSTVAGQYAGSVLRLLFINGQPTANHKQALESAAWELGLRHVFGIDGLHNWATSVYLQFGFTRRGFEARLPFWLTAPQSRSDAVGHLLDGPMRSESFREMWNALRKYRRQNITDVRLEATLKNCPWVRPDWISSLQRLAKTKMHLGEGQSESQAAGIENVTDFLSEPTIKWDGVEVPQFTCYLQRLTELNLPEDDYTLLINGMVRARLQRQSDGGFAAYPEDTLRIPAIPSQVAQLLDSEKNVAFTQPLICWDAAEDITAFRISNGKRVEDIWKFPLQPQHDYTLVMSGDLTLDAPSQQWKTVGRWRFALLAGSNVSEAQVLVPEGACLWKSVKRDDHVADWTDAIFVRPIGAHRWGEETTAFVAHAPDVSVAFARCHGQSLVCKTAEGGTRVGPLTLAPGEKSTAPELTLGLIYGDIQARRRLPLPIHNIVGALHLENGERRPFAPETVLTTAMAQTDAFQLFPNGSWNREDIVLFEGELAVGKPLMRLATLPPLAGFGAPLSLRSRAYNDVEEPLIIAQEVTNPGYVTSVSQTLNEGGRFVRVYFKQPIEPDKGHNLIWWGRDGVVRLLSHTEFCAFSQTIEWCFSAPPAWGEPMVIAAAYDGARLGAWWAKDWDKLLDIVSLPTEAAALIRWLRLPVLNKRALHHIQKFAREYPADILTAWIGDLELLYGLQWGGSDERWLDAVRQVFSNWQPEIDDARHVLKALAPTSVGDRNTRLKFAARLLMRVDPYLMARVLGKWLLEYSTKTNSLSETKKTCTELRQALAETLDSPDTREQHLLEEAASTMACDENFVKRGLLQTAIRGFDGDYLTSADRSNITLALAVTPFRRLLAVRLLKQICP